MSAADFRATESRSGSGYLAVAIVFGNGQSRVKVASGEVSHSVALAGGWAVVRYIFKTPFAPAFVPVAGIAGAIVGLTLLIGLLAGRDVFKETPVTALRDI